MPKIFSEKGYRFYFYSHEVNEPPHVHVDKVGYSCKFWLNPVSMARNVGFSAKELREIRGMVETSQTLLLEAWHGYFGD